MNATTLTAPVREALDRLVNGSFRADSALYALRSSLAFEETASLLPAEAVGGFLKACEAAEAALLELRRAAIAVQLEGAKARVGAEA